MVSRQKSKKHLYLLKTILSDRLLNLMRLSSFYLNRQMFMKKIFYSSSWGVFRERDSSGGALARRTEMREAHEV
jgi:hypothetical protein